MAYVKLNGHRTWTRGPKGRGRIVVLLHGGHSSTNSLWRYLRPGITRHFALAGFDRRGHGRTADTDAPFSYESMADETIAYIEHLGKRVHLLGHSDGGVVALIVARRRPDLVRRVVVVGAVFHRSGLVPMEEFTVESPDFPDFAESFGRHSPDGVEYAAVVMEKTLDLYRREPTMTVADVAAIERPVLVMSGDDDVATLSHTVELFEALAEGQLAILPGASHSVLKEHTKEVVGLITRFLRSPVPPRTRYPLRRRVPDGPKTQ